nr:NADH dehydrogenase subunit 5 [Liposcelis bostrychophila]
MMNKIFNLLLFLLSALLLCMFSWGNLFIQIDMFSPFSSISWSWLFFFDAYSASFSFVVLLISASIVFYSVSYMRQEKEKIKFFLTLFMFILSMLILIFSFNISSLLVGWDGLGVTSFLLIYFYHSLKSTNSSLITLTLNRVGDLMIIFSTTMGLMVYTWNFFFSEETIKVFNFLLVTAALSKSAQLPFSSWLPLAMAAPTPVSSLVHSSTLVTAGVYLLYRAPMSMISCLSNYIFFITSLTLIMSSVLALQSFDLKEIVAFSTMSHISLMMMGISNGLYKFSFFHLCTHALFKSLLFMCSGYLIYLHGGKQDIRTLHLNFQNYKVKYIFFISSCSMMGLPFMAGFYSKDGLIDESSFLSVSMLFVIPVLLSSLYTMRLLFYICLSKTSGISLKTNDMMSFSMFSLSWFSIFGGAAIQWSLFPLLFISMMPQLKILILIMLIVSSLVLLYSPKFKYVNLFFFLLVNKTYFLNFNSTKLSRSFFFLEKGWLTSPFSTLLQWSAVSLSNKTLVWGLSLVTIMAFL